MKEEGDGMIEGPRCRREWGCPWGEVVSCEATGKLISAVRDETWVFSRWEVGDDVSFLQAQIDHIAKHLKGEHDEESVGEGKDRGDGVGDSEG